MSVSLRIRRGGCRRHARATFSSSMHSPCATMRKRFFRVFTKLQRPCSASVQQNPSAIIFCCRKSAAFSPNRISSFTFSLITRLIFLPSWKTANSILLFWKDFLTSSAMTFSCSARNRISASAPPAIPSPENRFPSRISSPNA